MFLVSEGETAEFITDSPTEAGNSNWYLKILKYKKSVKNIEKKYEYIEFKCNSRKTQEFLQEVTARWNKFIQMKVKISYINKNWI